MNNMPPMDMPQDMGGADMGGNFMPQGDMSQPPMDGDMPMDDGMGGQNEFDTNFDAGVEADEEQDPKKFIQQLTGKLSQSLRKYNEDNGQPDVDLNKYVTGMVVKQSMEGLSQEDADEIIDKVKADEDFSMEGDEQGQEMPQQEQMPDEQGQQMQPQDMGQQQFNEWASKRHKKQLSEIVTNDLTNSEEEEKPYEEAPKKDRDSFKKKPFSSPKFEKKQLKEGFQEKYEHATDVIDYYDGMLQSGEIDKLSDVQKKQLEEVVNFLEQTNANDNPNLDYWLGLAKEILLK